MAENTFENENFEVNDIDKSYHVLYYTNEELIDIVLHQDEWSNFDYVLAQKLLEERGVKVDYEQPQLIDLEVKETDNQKSNKLLFQIIGILLILLIVFVFALAL